LVVVLANPTNRVLRGYAAELGNASQGGSRAAFAATAGDLHPDTVDSQAMRLLEGRSGSLRAER
jgi:hypothetical protein